MFQLYKIDSFKGQVYYGSRLRLIWPLSNMSGLRDAIRRVLAEVPDLEFRESRSEEEPYETKRRGKLGLRGRTVLTTGVDEIILVASGDIDRETWDRLHQTVHGIVIGDLGLTPVDIRSYQIRCAVEFVSRVNFYELLMRTLFRDSPMAELMQENLLYEFDPLFGFVWPRNSHRKYSLDFTSNQEYGNVTGDSPQEEGLLLITFSREVDQEDFAIADSVVAQVHESRHQFLQALEEFLVPKIIDPVRDKLSARG